MSMRRSGTTTVASTTPINEAVAATAAQEFEKLTETEKAVASLGIDPDAWKPIGFMNKKHFDTLMSNNAIDSTLARRIAAYQVVAEA